MVTAEQIDSIKNQYPHLSEQQITDMLMKSKEDNLKSLYPHLTDDQIDDYLKSKQVSEELAVKRADALAKARAAKSAGKKTAAK